MLINKSKTIFKYLSYGLICFAFTVCFAFITNYVYKELKITDVLLLEGILFSLLGISSLLGDNPNSTFDKEFIKIVSPNTKENKNKELNGHCSLDPIVDSYATAIIFVSSGILTIITSTLI